LVDSGLMRLSFPLRAVVTWSLVQFSLLLLPALRGAETMTRLDSSFRAGEVQGNYVYSIVARSDGRIWAGGEFTRLGGAAVTNLALLEPDGTLVAGYVSRVNKNLLVQSLLIESDGGCVVAGNFDGSTSSPSEAGETRELFRVRPDGQIDADFIGTTNTSGSIVRLVRLGNGDILSVGRPSVIDGQQRGGIAKFSLDGRLDSTFGTNFLARWFESEREFWISWVMDAVALPDGGFLIGGQFSAINEHVTYGLARLDSSGNLLTNWVSPLSGETTNFTMVNALRLLGNGSVLVAGRLPVPGSTNVACLLRLKPDLTVDESFRRYAFDRPFWSPELLQAGLHPPASAASICLLPDKRIALGGWFYVVDKFWRPGLAVFQADGTLDTAVDMGFGIGFPTSPIYPIISMIAGDSGVLWVAGTLPSFDGKDSKLLAKLTLGSGGPHQRTMLQRYDFAPGFDWESARGWSVISFFPAGHTGHLQRSTNLIDWETISTSGPPFTITYLTNSIGSPFGNSPPDAAYTINHAEAIQPNAFFRLLTQPD
jgi:hypothetical protein